MNKKVVDVIIDSDTYNEIDDQFAIVYGLLSKEAVNIKAIHAAPFFNRNSSSPKDGMLKSYQEIKHIYTLLSICQKEQIYLGSDRFLKDEKTFVDSEAARHLVALAMASKEKISVVAIAALTNIASAILMEPSIVHRIKVIWLGGHDYHQETNNEFNLRQDIAAARVVFNSQVEFVHIPCNGVISNLVLTQAELEKFIDGKNSIGTYLTDIFRRCNTDTLSYARIISDIAAMAYVIHPEWFTVKICPKPNIMEDLSYQFDASKCLETKVTALQRNQIIDDVLMKIASV